MYPSDSAPLSGNFLEGKLRRFRRDKSRPSRHEQRSCRHPAGEIAPCQSPCTKTTWHLHFSPRRTNRQSFSSISIRNQNGTKLSWLLRGRRRGIEASVDRKFLFCLFLVTGSLQSCGERVMDSGISRR